MSTPVTLTKRGATRTFDEAFIRSRVDFMESGCWEYRGGERDRGKHVQVHWSYSSREYAHRLSYRIFVGDIPAGLFVCHHCDNPPCVNPDHLYAGTQRQNVADMIARGRARNGHAISKWGDDNPCARPKEEVFAARDLSAQGLRNAEIGRQLNVPPSTIRRWLVGQHRTRDVAP